MPGIHTTPRNQMVLPMTVAADDAEPFSTIEDADDFADCELRGFGFQTSVIGGRILLFKRNGGYFFSIGFEPAPAIPHPGPA